MLDVRGDRLVGQLFDEVRLPVQLEARRVQPVERGVQRRVWHGADALRKDRRHVVQRFERALALVG